MGEDGSCPTCGAVIAEPVKAPWHFKLMLLALMLYRRSDYTMPLTQL